MIRLANRTREHVIEFWKSTQHEEFERVFPGLLKPLNEALTLFEATQMPNATSYGQVIYAENKYVGDVWIFAIDEHREKMAMMSIVIFDKGSWGKGIASEVIQKFIKISFDRYDIEKIGAFTFAHNVGSIKALEKSGFIRMESFVDKGVKSYYFECLRKGTVPFTSL